jgi:ABC-type uncharacterized transport system substrate-binding protein
MKWAIVVLLSIIGSGVVYSEPTSPVDNKGKPFRIAYLEGGAYINYPQNLVAYVDALSELGWLGKLNLSRYTDDINIAKLWSFLAANAKSKYIEFVPDGFYTNNWDTELRKQTKERLICRLNDKKDIDFIIAMGTWAGQDLANNRHGVPTMVFSASDPIKSGIIKSEVDSGFSHVHARVDPTRYERQVRLFHDIIKFKKLGVAYENSPSGVIYSAVNDIEKAAKERKFEIVPCYTQANVSDPLVAISSVIDCHQKLALKIDAMYITVQSGTQSMKYMEQILQPLIDKKIPTFSQLGADHVKCGVLLCIAQANFKYVAIFHAKVTAKIFNGASPGNIEQLFEDPPKLSINLETARLIGYDPPIDMIGAADEVIEKTFRGGITERP